MCENPQNGAGTSDTCRASVSGRRCSTLVRVRSSMSTYRAACLENPREVHSKEAVSGKTSRLRKIRVQDCEASRPEDVQEILAKIEDKDVGQAFCLDLMVSCNVLHLFWPGGVQSRAAEGLVHGSRQPLPTALPQPALAERSAECRAGVLGLTPRRDVTWRTRRRIRHLRRASVTEGRRRGAAGRN